MRKWVLVLAGALGACGPAESTDTDVEISGTIIPGVQNCSNYDQSYTEVTGIWDAQYDGVQTESWYFSVYYRDGSHLNLNTTSLFLYGCVIDDSGLEVNEFNGGISVAVDGPWDAVPLSPNLPNSLNSIYGGYDQVVAGDEDIFNISSNAVPGSGVITLHPTSASGSFEVDGDPALMVEEGDEAVKLTVAFDLSW